MVASRTIAGLMGAGVALSLLAIAPGQAATSHSLKKKSALTIATPGGIGSFTPAAADPRRATMVAVQGFGGNGFRFTPASAPGSRRAVTVAVRARAVTPAAVQKTAAAPVALASVAPNAYNLGVSIGWKRFAISGDIAKSEGSLLPNDREALDLGFSFTGNTWSTRLQIGADRSIGNRPSLIGSDQSYSLDLGGSYALTRNLDVTGGLRYKVQLDRLEHIADERRDSQAVYIGTAFRF